MAKRIVAYVRVSTDEQHVETQITAISKFCALHGRDILETYQDVGLSGAQDSRPALDKLKRDCASGKIDSVVVFKFDRLARSVSHLLECLELFRRNQIDFISISEGIDTSSAVGRMVFTFLGAVAEFERSLIKERVAAGIARAQSEGVHCGRPRKGLDIGLALSLHKQGRSVREIARVVHASSSSVHRSLRAALGAR